MKIKKTNERKMQNRKTCHHELVEVNLPDTEQIRKKKHKRGKTISFASAEIRGNQRKLVS